jgi:DNA-binding transcriptional ArsR family regulator
MHLKDIAKILYTAGEENRLKILCVIFENKKRCVSAIAEDLGLSVAIVSHHLQVMAKKGLVQPIRTGKSVCYEVPKDALVQDLKKFICKYK